MKRCMLWLIALLVSAGLSMPLGATPLFESEIDSEEPDLWGGARKFGGNYYFYQGGDGWSVDLLNTGLETVRAVDLGIRIVYNDISQSQKEHPEHPGVMHWGVFLDDRKVGAWSWSHGQGGISGPSRHPLGSVVDLSLSFSGFEVKSQGNTAYELKMLVGESLQSGAGSLALEMQSARLSQDPVPVPEPGVALLMLSGLGFVAYFRYRSRAGTAAGRRVFRARPETGTV